MSAMRSAVFGAVRNFFGSPVGQVVLGQGLGILGSYWLGRRAAEPRKGLGDALRADLKETEALLRELEAETGRAGAGAASIGSPGPRPETPTGEPAPGAAGGPGEAADRRDGSEAEGTDAGGEAYSRYAPEMKVDSACLPCTKAHLALVSGALDESLRFAREDGVDHPEVTERLASVGRELVTMERFDLTPAKIQASPPEDQRVVRELLPRIRKLRQQVLNGIASTEDLERAAAEAEQLFAQAMRASKRAIDWKQVESELFPEAKAGEEKAEEPANQEPREAGGEVPPAAQLGL